MNSLYQVLTDLACWISLFFLACSLTAVAVNLFYPKLDLDNLTLFLRSVLYWFIPQKEDSSGLQSFFFIVSFLFRVCVITVPLFLFAHSCILQELFGWGFPVVFDHKLSDYMTLMAICCALIMVGRCLIFPDLCKSVRRWDYIFLFFIMAPFITGYFAYHQIGNYQLMMTLHILFGEILLIIVPLRKLGHFFFPPRRTIFF